MKNKLAELKNKHGLTNGMIASMTGFPEQSVAIYCTPYMIGKKSTERAADMVRMKVDLLTMDIRQFVYEKQLPLKQKDSLIYKCQMIVKSKLDWFSEENQVVIKIIGGE